MAIRTIQGGLLIEDLITEYLTKDGDTQPIFPVLYQNKKVGTVTYTLSLDPDKLNAAVIITDKRIVEDIRAGKKWIDLSVRDRGEVRDIEKKE